MRGNGGIRSIGLATRGMAGEKEGITMVIARFLSLVNRKHVLHSLKRGNTGEDSGSEDINTSSRGKETRNI